MEHRWTKPCREPACSVGGDGSNGAIICDDCADELAWELWGPPEDDPRFWEEAGFSIIEVTDRREL